MARSASSARSFADGSLNGSATPWLAGLQRLGIHRTSPSPRPNEPPASRNVASLRAPSFSREFRGSAKRAALRATREAASSSQPCSQAQPASGDRQAGQAQPAAQLPAGRKSPSLRSRRSFKKGCACGVPGFSPPSRPPSTLRAAPFMPLLFPLKKPLSPTPFPFQPFPAHPPRLPRRAFSKHARGRRVAEQTAPLNRTPDSSSSSPSYLSARERRSGSPLLDCVNILEERVLVAKAVLAFWLLTGRRNSPGESTGRSKAACSLPPSPSASTSTCGPRPGNKIITLRPLLVNYNRVAAAEGDGPQLCCRRGRLGNTAKSIGRADFTKHRSPT